MKYLAFLLLMCSSCAAIDQMEFNQHLSDGWRDYAYIRCTGQAQVVCDGAGSRVSACMHTVYSGCARGFK